MITGKSGQIGSLLNKRLSASEHDKVLIHLGWSLQNKNDRKLQETCIDHTKDMVKHANANGMRFIFVSTSSKNDNEYVRAKRSAEDYVEDNADDWMVIRLPNVMGKGVLNFFIDKAKIGENIICFGNKIDFVTLDAAVDFIKKCIGSELNYMELRGHTIDDKLLKELVEYVIKYIQPSG